jgi:PrtD family type I secretion system ABC transporter
MILEQENILEKLLKSCKKAFFFILLFSFFLSIFTLASSIYSLQVLDRVLSSGSIETLIYLTIIVLVFLIFFAFLTQIRALVFLHISNWLDEKISPILLSATIENGGANKNITAQNIRDLQNIKSFITSPNLSNLFDAPFALIYLLVIFFIHPLNGIITTLGAFLMIKIAYLNDKLTAKLIEQNNQAQQKVFRDFEIIASNSEIINVMGMRENVSPNWQKSNDEFRQIASDLAAISNKISTISKVARMVLQTITMACGAVLVIFNKMSSGGIIATSILAGKALAPLDNIIGAWKSLKTTKESYLRLNKNLENFVLDKNKIELPAISGNLLVEKLIYKNEQTNRLIIKGISFKINAGEVVAIIGPSGGGKTTLARLLLGVLKPNSGSIRLDSADLTNQDFEKIGKYVGYLPQDVELFQGSVKDNIARMKKEVSDAEIISAADFCNIHQMILNLPNGYETEIAKDASNLSAGQKQRIALARAYFGAAKFVVLDEPNSNLDSEGEKALNETILRAKAKNITTIIITHRRNVAAVCDRIMVVNNGEIVSFNDSKNILEKFS